MVGQEISHYRIVRQIGEGGIGEVYAAQDLNLDRLVALKFLLRTQTLDDQAAAGLLENPPLGVEVQEDWLRAHAALAQIRERQGRTGPARELYQRLLTPWKNADADAVLPQARAGRART